MSRSYVYSTLTNDHFYTNFKPQSAPGQALEIDTQVLIKGGANRADTRLITPTGVRTEVSEAQLEQLQRNVIFNRHVKQGFIRVSSSREDAEDIAKDMEARDAAAPLTPESPMFQREGEGSVKPAKKGDKKSKG